MEKLKEFIEKKKEKSASRRPRYGTRKLSVGLVSCVLGYCIFFSPTVVSAAVEDGSESTSSTSIEARVDTSDSDSESESDETKAVETPSAATNEVESPQAKASVSEVADKAPAAEAPVAEAEKEEPAEEVVEAEKEEPAVSEEKLEPVAEEDAETKEVSKKEEIEALKANKEANIEETVAADKKENKTEETTPKAEENKDALKSEDDKEAIVEDEKVEETEAAKVEKTETQAEPTSKEVANEELLLNEKPEPEALQAGETEEDAITNVEITIGGAKNGEKTEIVNPTALPKRTNEGNTDINLEARVDFDIPEGTKAGRTFDFEVSDNVNLHGILVDEDKAVPVEYDGVEIATGTKLTDGRRGYRYTFNKNVDGLKDIRVRILYPLWIDPDEVPLNSEKETVTVKVAGEQASKDYKIEYENVVSEDKLGSTTLSGIANIEEVTSDSYEHIIYVNPRGDQGLINSNVTIENDVDHDSATFDEDVKNSVEVYKVIDSDKLPLSFGNNFDDGNYEDVTNKAKVKLVPDGNKNKLVVNVNQGDAKNYYKDDAYDKSAYIIKYKGKRAPEKETKTKITFKADRRLLNGKKESLVTDGKFAWTWTNEIVFDDAEAVAEANRRAAERWSLGDKVWIDEDKNGSQGDNEKGLDGVTVTLRGINMSPRTTETKDGGKYIFEDLPNGEYTVEFEIPSGYAPTTANKDGVEDKDNSDASQAQGEKVATAIGEINGADNMNVDFGVIESEAPVEETHALGDRVWIDDNKDGIQTDGEKGVEGVTVKLTGGDLTEAKTTKTDANGNYKFEGLKNGDYKVTFEVPESYEVTKTDEGTDDEKDSDGKEVTVTIKDKDNMSVDLGLVKKETPAPVEETHTLGDRVWLDDNKDGLQTEGEKGVKGVTVKLTGGDLTEAKTTKTDANGNYKFEGLKNGEYKVKFEIPEEYEVTKTDQGEDDAVDSDGTEVTVTIKDADNMTVDLGLVKKETPAPVEETHTLGDRVWLDDNKDGLQTEGEKGVKGVTVKLTGGDLTEEKTTTTDENGNYKFEGLKNGEYKVKFEIPEEYEVTKTDQGEDDAVDSDGTEVTVTIKDADNMTVDLGLVKKETPTPVEPSEPEEPKHTTPLVPLTPAEKVEEIKEEAKTVEDDNLEKPQAPENNDKLAPRAPEKDKAPKTGDAGILSSLGLGSLAASGLAFIELKKRNKKNK